MTRGNTVWLWPQEKENIVKIAKGDGHLPDLLYELLHHASPHGMEKHIVNLFPFKKDGKIDDFGNFILKIGEKPTTLFSCHMDTVHDVDQKFIDSGQKGFIHLITMPLDAPDTEQGYVWGAINNKDTNPKSLYSPVQLGADDKAGCWIMSEMIDHEIPGLYIFHCGEEKGGLGSAHILKNTPALLQGIERAVAFDRANTMDIIGHQRGGRCASLKFMRALADQINRFMPPSNLYKTDIHGTFTDTANYITLIRECTNISVGYYNQHSGSEKLDYYYLTKTLLPAVLQINWDELPSERELSKPYSYGNSRIYHQVDGVYGYTENGVFTANTHQYNQTDRTIAFKHIGRWTAAHLIPEWKPADGIPDGITVQGFAATCQKWINKTPNQDVADITAACLIFAETAKMKIKLLERKLAIADHFLGDDTQTGKRTLDLIIETHKNFDAVEDADYSDVSADEKGFPLDQKEIDKRASDKLVIMGVYVSQRTATKMNTEQQGRFGSLVGRYNKLKGHMQQCKQVNVSKKLYLGLNAIMYKMTEVMRECDTSAIAESAIEQVLDYIKENPNEPGFPQKAEIQVG